MPTTPSLQKSSFIVTIRQTTCQQTILRENDATRGDKFYREVKQFLPEREERVLDSYCYGSDENAGVPVFLGTPAPGNPQAPGVLVTDTRVSASAFVMRSAAYAAVHQTRRLT